MDETIYFDCETFLITPDNPTPKLVCMQWAVGDSPVTIDRSGDRAREWLASGRTIVAHNGFYDWSVLLAGGYVDHAAIWDGYASGRIRDTLPVAALHAIEHDWMRADPTNNYAPADLSLAGLARTFLDRTIAKGSVRLSYGDLAPLPTEAWPIEAIEYAITDVTTLRDLWRVLPHDTPDERRQTLAYWCLRLMEVQGITTSPAALDRLLAAIEPERERLHAYLIEHGIMSRPPRRADHSRMLAETGGRSRASCLAAGKPPPGDPYWWHPPEPPRKSIAAIRERVVAALGQDAPTTDTGAISTERAVLLATRDPVLTALAEVGAIDKIMTTYVPVFRQPVCHPRWDGLKETGRVSVSRPNLNNIPREIRGQGIVRQCFVARPGYAFIDADYTQAELCALAQVCYEMFGYSRMRDVIISNQDIHHYMSAAIQGISYAAAVAQGKSYPIRTLAKAANFGFPGGLGPRKFCQFALDTYGVVITEDRARTLKREWLEAFPEVGEMFAWVNERLRYSPTFTLEQLRSGRLRGGCGYCDGANSLFQGLTADGAKAALVLITKECYLVPESPLYGSRVNALIYDEFLIETPVERVGAAAERLRQCMIDGMKWATPDVPVSVTVEAMYHWTKKIEPRYENGLLVPSDERME